MAARAHTFCAQYPKCFSIVKPQTHLTHANTDTCVYRTPFAHLSPPITLISAPLVQNWTQISNDKLPFGYCREFRSLSITWLSQKLVIQYQQQQLCIYNKKKKKKVIEKIIFRNSMEGNMFTLWNYLYYHGKMWPMTSLVVFHKAVFWACYFSYCTCCPLTTLSDSITFIQNRYADDKQLYVSVETDDTVFNLN